MMEEQGIVDPSAAKPVSARMTPAIPTGEELDLEEEIAVGTRADANLKPKTTMPKIAGGYKLPSIACCIGLMSNRPIDEEELKELAQVLVEKCAEFDVHGQITQINPGPVVTTFEFKPEAGIKYSRITGLSRRSLPGDARREHPHRAHGRQIAPSASRCRTTSARRSGCARWSSPASSSATSRRLTLALGKDINGRIVTSPIWPPCRTC